MTFELTTKPLGADGVANDQPSALLCSGCGYRGWLPSSLICPRSFDSRRVRGIACWQLAAGGSKDLEHHRSILRPHRHVIMQPLIRSAVREESLPCDQRARDIYLFNGHGQQ